LLLLRTGDFHHPPAPSNPHLQACPSLVSLRLHQMSWPAPPSPRSLLTCPLACGAPGLTAASLPTHLVTFHGAEEGSEERVVAGKSMGPGVVRCPECSTELRVDLITHRLLHCYSRSPVVKARVAKLVALAEEQGVTPLVMVSQEVEATLSHLSRLSSPAYREEWERGGREAARRYPGVAAALLQELAWVPPGVESGSGLLPGFQLWESVVERLEAAGGLEATNARLEKELGAVWMALEEDTVLTTDQPDVAVVEQLQAELGWARGGREAAPQGLEAVMERLQAQLA